MGKNPLFMLILSIIISLPLNVVAVEPSEILQNPQLETRARSLSQNIRCLVCQNQSIDDSNASLAKDLRKIVREQLVSGASDDEIYNFLNKEIENDIDNNLLKENYIKILILIAPAIPHFSHECLEDLGHVELLLSLIHI